LFLNTEEIEPADDGDPCEIRGLGWLPRDFWRCANLPGPGTRFIFKRAEAEIAGAATIREVFAHERFKAATAFALGDVNELMNQQLPVLPAIGADNYAMTDGDGFGGVRDDLGVPGCICQFFVVGHRNAVNHKDPDSSRVLNSGALGVGNLIPGQRSTVFEDVGLLAFRPLAGERGKAFEILLFNHIWEKSLGLVKQGACEVRA
jgi:hypothetical protein